MPSTGNRDHPRYVRPVGSNRAAYPHHLEAAQILDADPDPYIIPVAAIAEMAYMIETEFPPTVEQAFLLHNSENEWLRF